MASTSTALPPPVFDVVEICLEASERAGIEFRSGYVLQTARRSLQLLTLEWCSRGLNLWQIEWDTLGLEPGVNPIPLPPDTIDVLDVSLRRTNLNTVSGPTDTWLSRMGSGDWAMVSQKEQPGTPYRFYVQRLTAPVLFLNPVPNQQLIDNGAALYYSRLRYMQTIPRGGAGVPEIPLRFVNALISGLAFHLAMKSREPGPRSQAPMLRELYEADFQLAADEDRERISFFARPAGGCGCGGWYY